MIVDEIELYVSAGHGGAGKVSFGPGKDSGPDGGNGGRGGDVYIKTTTDLGALSRYQSNNKINAENGQPGQKKKMYGKDGKDVTLIIPIGSLIEDTESGEVWEILNPNDEFLICKGGLGGKGNFEFRSSRNTTPTYAQPGLEGQQRILKINLRFLAEFGLVGLPNAGKSSLLNAMTNAKAVVGNYPFTTLEPNLGSFDGRIIADIPGLIEGASQGKGLGIKFLKHIDRVNTIIHCISAESETVEKDYQTIVNELNNYDSKLLIKNQILVITKADLKNEQEINKIKEILSKYSSNIIVTSTDEEVGVNELKIELRKIVSAKEQKSIVEITNYELPSSSSIKYEWIDLDNLIEAANYEPITQAYGICVDNNLRVCLISAPDNEEWCLPGGTVEDGESLDQTLIREVKEEADLKIRNIHFLGLQAVIKNGKIHCYQSRWFALVDQIEDQTIDPATNVILKRIFVDWDEAIKLLNWGEVADIFFDKAKQILKRQFNV